MAPAIEMRRVSKWYPRRTYSLAPWKQRDKIQVLDRLDLEIQPGAIFVLVGPNGVGKTTLLKILATLVLPDDGEVWVQGYSRTRHASRIRRILSFAIGEEWSFYGRLTARQNLEFFSRLHNLSSKEMKQKIQEATHLFALDGFLDRTYETLSTGTRHRLGIARSFLSGASILLADEPTRSLDPLSKRELQALLKRLSREWGKTILFTTHDLREAEEMGDTIGILHQGRILGVGKAEELSALNGQGNLEEVFADICQGETGCADTS